MVKNKFTPEQKIQIVLESIRINTSTAELCRKHNVNPQTFHNWKQRFMARTLKQLASFCPADTAIIDAVELKNAA